MSLECYRKSLKTESSPYTIGASPLRCQLKRLGLLLPFVLISLCLTGCSDKTLTRSKAEEILREHPPKEITNDAYTNDHKTREAYFVNEPQTADFVADLAFLDALADSGILKREPDFQSTTFNGPMVHRIYKVVAQPGITLLYAGSDDEDAVFTLARPVIKGVTGISQDGTEATVVAEVGWDPTDIYKRSIPKVQAALDKCATVHGPPPFNNKPYYCYHWPTKGDLSTTKSVTFNFKRYDDGWRIEDSDQQ